MKIRNKNKSKREMYQEAETSRQTRRLIGILIGMAALAIVSWFFIDWWQGRREPLSTMSTPSSYSMPEMKEFWTNHFQQTVEKELFGNKYPLPKIQGRFNIDRKLIAKRHHADLAFSLNPGYMPESRYIMAGSSMLNGRPTVEIMVPVLMDIYYLEQRKNELGWEDKMRYVIVTSVLHELDHLASEDTRATRERPPTLDELVDNERKVWALTCEYTIRPLVEDYRIAISDNDMIYYNDWVKAGRNVDSPSWSNFIYQAYKKTRQ